MKNHYDEWKSEPYKCPDCGWEGAGFDLVQGELDSALYSMCCPSCFEDLEEVLLPLIEEAAEHREEMPPQEQALLNQRIHLSLSSPFTGLEDPRELPQVYRFRFVIHWDLVSDDGFTVVLRHGNRELYRQPAYYEDYESFVRAAEAMHARYGRRIKDLIPTSRSETWLLGDAVRAIFAVNRSRSWLAGKYRNDESPDKVPMDIF